MRQDARYVPGMRIELRDAEWRIDRVDMPSHGGQRLECTGQSELVRGRTGTFLTDLESGTRILSPETTALVDDLSGGYAATQLRIHALLESTPPADENIHLGHEAAMDLLPYQLDPALQALRQTRPRILIADAVGLGKTLGAGILMTELIRRGRGKRILVLGVKSMLGQLQREFWQRFTIPLTRLDSIGLQRIRNTIPTNHNPFHHIDRAIISIDTLKQSLEYRHYLETCHWDIVVIDEAHNVARRSSNSQRHRLAELLCTRCDAMIMLSATPHDGRPESFASLIRMLDPTAIPDPSSYAAEDYRDKGLVIRRFKADVAEQLRTALPERVVHPRFVPASAPENHAFETVRGATFRTLNGRSSGAGQLFRTTLEKALLSSPAACLSTVDNRLKQLAKKAPEADGVAEDVGQLEAIRAAVEAVEPATFSKYRLLVDMLTDGGEHGIGWDRGDPCDRIVLFTESVVTLGFLETHLPKALKLKATKAKREYAVLHGGLRDIELMETVNAFNRPDDALRLLLCSDVASEGLNLHHCSHRLIHFDIPWSLLVFQQRNGRIDRYGQTVAPEIHYLLAEAADEDVRRDQRVLDVLIEKDTMASLNLGDPSEFQSGDSVAEQEAETAALIEADDGAIDFESLFDDIAAGKRDALEPFDTHRGPTTSHDLRDVTLSGGGLYPDARAFLSAGLRWLGEGDRPVEWATHDGLVVLEAPRDLQARSRRLPREALPKDFRYVLSDDKARIMADMVEARDTECGGFGELHYLWPQHPVMDWLRTRVADAFGRHAAPVVRLPDRLGADEHWFLAHGGFPNRRGQALIQDHVAVQFTGERVTELLPLGEALARLGLDGEPIPNRGEPRGCEALTLYLDDVVSYLRRYLQGLRQGEIAKRTAEIERELDALAALRDRHIDQLEMDLGKSAEAESRKERKRRERHEQIVRHFEDYERWLRDSVATEDEPYIQIIAVVTGDKGERLAPDTTDERNTGTERERA